MQVELFVSNIELAGQTQLQMGCQVGYACQKKYIL